MILGQFVNGAFSLPTRRIRTNGFQSKILASIQSEMLYPSNVAAPLPLLEGFLIQQTLLSKEGKFAKCRPCRMLRPISFGFFLIDDFPLYSQIYTEIMMKNRMCCFMSIK